MFYYLVVVDDFLKVSTLRLRNSKAIKKTSISGLPYGHDVGTGFADAHPYSTT